MAAHAVHLTCRSCDLNALHLQLWNCLREVGIEGCLPTTTTVRAASFSQSLCACHSWLQSLNRHTYLCAQHPVPNAYTLAIAGRKPFIVIHTALLELLTPRELQVRIELCMLRLGGGVGVDHLVDLPAQLPLGHTSITASEAVLAHELGHLKVGCYMYSVLGGNLGAYALLSSRNESLQVSEYWLPNLDHCALPHGAANAAASACSFN
eukprot:1157782-Pelagomonas_calceolata.AAC.4